MGVSVVNPYVPPQQSGPAIIRRKPRMHNPNIVRRRKRGPYANNRYSDSVVLASVERILKTHTSESLGTAVPQTMAKINADERLGPRIGRRVRV